MFAALNEGLNQRDHDVNVYSDVKATFKTSEARQLITKFRSFVASKKITAMNVITI